MKKLLILLILLLSIPITANAAVSVRGGLRLSDIVIGIEEQPLTYANWSLGYGGEVSASLNQLVTYFSINKLFKRYKRIPVYLSFGPELIFTQKHGGVGAFIKVGWLSVLSTKGLVFDVGLDLLPAQFGISAQMGYRF